MNTSPRRLFGGCDNGKPYLQHLGPVPEEPPFGCRRKNDLYPLIQLPDGSWKCKNHCRRKWTKEEGESAINSFEVVRNERGKITKFIFKD
jgi:hypothetical protein